MELSREHLSAAATATFEHTAAELRNGADAAACAGICRRLNRQFDAEYASLRRDGAAVACEPGCDYCCHLRVEVFPHEAAALVHYLRTQAPADEALAIERRIRANAARVAQLTPAEHRTAGIACAFLVDGRCSAHEVRPSACAAYHSMSRARCEHAFRHPHLIGTPLNSRPASLQLQVFGSQQIEATNAAYAAAAREGRQAELHQAVCALLYAGSRAP